MNIEVLFTEAVLIKIKASFRAIILLDFFIDILFNIHSYCSPYSGLSANLLSGACNLPGINVGQEL
jgi:hypothetical protein